MSQIIIDGVTFARNSDSSGFAVIFPKIYDPTEIESIRDSLTNQGFPVAHPAIPEPMAIVFSIRALRQRDAELAHVSTYIESHVLGTLGRAMTGQEITDELMRRSDERDEEVKALESQLAAAQAERERLRGLVDSAEFREVFAAIAHDQWSGWLKYMFGLCVAIVHEGWPKTVIPDESVLRWTRQMQTLYTNLPENEKDSDRIEADKYLKVLRAALAEPRAGAETR